MHFPCYFSCNALIVIASVAWQSPRRDTTLKTRFASAGFSRRFTPQNDIKNFPYKTARICKNELPEESENSMNFWGSLQVLTRARTDVRNRVGFCKNAEKSLIFGFFHGINSERTF